MPESAAALRCHHVRVYGELLVLFFAIGFWLVETHPCLHIMLNINDLRAAWIAYPIVARATPFDAHSLHLLGRNVEEAGGLDCCQKYRKAIGLLVGLGY